MEKLKILVPTDFSDCAINALNFAVEIAEQLKADLTILHSIVYSERSFKNSQAREAFNTNLYNTAKENLDSAVAYARTKNKSLSIKSILDGGTPGHTIETILHQLKIDYVDMGTEGVSGFKAAVFGSFTSHVLSISPCPVFTIPLVGNFGEIRNILCATEMDYSENKAILETLELAKNLDATITFFNVNEDKMEQEVLFKKFQKKISSITDYPAIKFSLAESNDIIGSIEEYVIENNPDLIVTLGKEHNIFDTLFGKKITKKLSMHTTVPLLSYPSYHLSKEMELQDLINEYHLKKHI
jgi:nucleotide-binding universal stress UspA family protein